ncbi:replication endonuclease [Halomonas sp. M4R5S39]|uniref:replication endonuclease n=1 Tax=Halomonas kalidii TaxID=3043293 RepID=UPI0024A82957|nr:replication endonuclease [Halomonas kalidii]MDI5984907.1 replication endonuclease [Halomonas kalidii]
MSSHQTAIDRQAMADALRRCGPWYCTDDDDALVSHAEQQADAIDRIRMGGTAEALAAGTRRVVAHGLELPDAESDRGTVARLCCGLWWRRQLRRLNARRLEQADRILGRVHDRAGIYVSNRGMEARRRQHVRNRRILEAVAAVNEAGQEYTLAELAELGLANPNNRRAELMLRIADTEREAMRLGHVGVFVTITCPSRFHAVWRGTARHNPKWTAADCPDPREGQAYLQKLWSRARAKLGRKHLGVYGIRVVEPHHDGCPHWHLLLWTEAQNVGAVLGLLRAYALADSAAEVADDETVRFDAKVIDPELGCAAGYVAKYVSKNINGEQFNRQGVDGDHLDAYGHDLTTSAPRIEAWAATWGIRQFQFFGLPSVTVWRELRRLRDPAALVAWLTEREPGEDAMLAASELRRTADRGEWAGFLRAMGGPMTKRDHQPARPWHIDRLAGGGGEIQTGRYGEPLKTTLGIVVHGVELLTKHHLWTTRRRDSGQGFDLEGLTFGAEGDAWTRVNNCTLRIEREARQAIRGAFTGPLRFMGDPLSAKYHGGAPAHPLSRWERKITESCRDMWPPVYQSQIDKIRERQAADAEAYRYRSHRAKLTRELGRIEAADNRRRLEQGRRVIAGALLDRTMTPADLSPEMIEVLTA